MTDKEVILSIKTAGEFEKIKGKVDRGVFLDRDVEAHTRKLLGKTYYPEGVIVELPRIKENAWLFALNKCDLCRHLKDEDKCPAFPDGIPFENLSDDEHTECANGFKFEGDEEGYYKEYFRFWKNPDE